MAEMTSSKPYFVEAIYKWIIANHKTPFIEVNAVLPNVSVPPKYVKGGRIVLDINPGAVNNFHMGLDAISFEARFDNKVLPLYIPIYAINAIFAAENGQGMSFPPEEIDINLVEERKSLTSTDEASEPLALRSKKKSPAAKKDKPTLTLID